MEKHNAKYTDKCLNSIIGLLLQLLVSFSCLHAHAARGSVLGEFSDKAVIVLPG